MSVVRGIQGVQFCVAVVLLVPTGVAAQVEHGIAAQYPRDVGIEGHASVVFTESFEHASIDALLSRWDQAQHGENMSFVSDVPSNSPGNQALHISGGWGDLYRRILPGYDQIYARFYAKLDPSCVDVHHWVWLGGHNPPTAWPWPRAGTKPVGNERWSTGLEPFYRGATPQWRWAFYTYWMHMRIDRDGNYWGNLFHNNPPVPANRGEWIAIEFMVKLNQPASAFNGEQAFWINGVRSSHIGPGYPNARWERSSIFEEDPSAEAFEGFQFRSTTDLKINYFWLEHFVDNDLGCEATFDDVVLATEYIGPMVREASPPTDGGANTRDAGPAVDAVADAPVDVGTIADGPLRTDGRQHADGPASSDVLPSDQPNAPLEGGSGCSCRTTDPKGHGGGLWPLAGLLGLGLCLRRRRARGESPEQRRV